jgi:hypothetical protein
MGMSFYGGKSVSWISKGDKIGVNTKVTYRDQNGVESELDMKKLVEKCKKVKDNAMLTMLAKDIEEKKLTIGFPIISAMNELALNLPLEEVYEIVKGAKK